MLAPPPAGARPAYGPDPRQFGGRIDLRVVADADHFDPVDPRSAAFSAVRDAIATLS